MKRLKILFLAPGNSIHSYKWIKYFSNNNIVYWNFTGKLNYNIKNAIIQKLPSGVGLLFSPFIFLLKILIVRPDIIHIHSISKNLFIGIFVIIFFKKRVVLNPWGSDFFYPNFIVKKLQNFIKNNIILTDSFIIKKALIKNNFVHKINFGVNLSYFKKKKVRKKYKNKQIIFCPRGYSAIYNQRLILKFIKKNKKKLKNFLFVFSGMIEINEYNKIRNFIKKFEINNKVILYGSLKKDKYIKYLREAFLVVSASKSDAGLSSAIAEAMSCEALVMCTNNRDNPYWIKPKKNGFLFDNNNLEDFSKKFFEISSLSKNKINVIKKNARKIQQENNNLSSEMKKVYRIYNLIYKKNNQL